MQNFCSNIHFFPSLLWLQPYVVSEWPHWLGMWTQNSHLVSQYIFFFFYCRIQICKKNNNYYSKSFWNHLHAKPFASIHAETPVYSKKKNKYFVPLAELTEYSHVACRLSRTNAFCLSLLLLSLSLPHFLIHPLPLPLCFTLLWGGSYRWLCLIRRSGRWPVENRPGTPLI